MVDAFFEQRFKELSMRLEERELKEEIEEPLEERKQEIEEPIPVVSSPEETKQKLAEFFGPAKDENYFSKFPDAYIGRQKDRHRLRARIRQLANARKRE